MKFLNARGWKLYFLFVGIAALAAFFVTALILLPGYLQYKKTSRTAGQKGIQQEAGILLKYKIPGSYSKLLNEHWKHYYVPKEKWTNKDVEKYWINPKTMAVEYLKEKNQKMIEDIVAKYD